MTNYKHHGRGHRYFSLSEKGGGSTAAVIKCVMWRSDADRLAFTPAEGMEVIVSGSVTLYAPHGAYQLQVKKMEKAGLGEKYLLVEQWKKELAALGLFAAERKRELPAFPARIGVVTSETGAVIHDIRNVVERRYPVEIIISPTAVQGEGACREIAAAIRRLAGLVDVVIVARGGGSFEDLFEFNHPDVVRAIAACPVPVVSAIGHEVDVTLADLAADVRAPPRRLQPNSWSRTGTSSPSGCRNCGSGWIPPCSGGWHGQKRRSAASGTGSAPSGFSGGWMSGRRQQPILPTGSNGGSRTRLERERLLLAELQAALAGRSPRAVLARGYCVAEKDGRVVRGTGGIAKDDRLKLRFYDGSSEVSVERVDHDGNL